MDKFKKYLFWAALTLFIYMPFHIFLSQWLSTYTGGLELWKGAKDAFTAFLTAGLVGTVMWMRKYTRLYLQFLLIAFVYMALHLIVMLATDQPTDTGLLATIYNNRLIWYLLIGYSLALLVPKLAQPRQIAKIFLIVSTIVCVIALAQWILPKDIMTHFGYSVDRGVKPMFYIDDKLDFPRVFSTIRDPNSLGAFLMIGSTLSLLCLVRFWNTSKRMLFLGLNLLHGLIIILTFSRSAMIGTFIAHALALGFVFRQQLIVFLKRYVVVLAGVLVVVCLGVFTARDQYVVQNVLLHSDESTVLDDPNELRIKLLQTSVDGVVDDPEGHGPGTAGLVSTRLPQGLLTENYYLQLAYEVGVAGLLIFLGFLYLVLRDLWARRDRLIVQALLASFVGLAFMNLLLHTWANEAVALAWFMLAGLMVGQPVKADVNKKA
jgi:O-Antigen ligase